MAIPEEGRNEENASLVDACSTEPISIAAVKKGALQEPEHQSRVIAEYVEWQLNKGKDTGQKVVHLEKIKSEVVFGREHVCWDVHTNEPGRWRVITEPANLYSHHEFPSLDYTLSFHIGVTARVAARDAKCAPDGRKDSLWLNSQKTMFHVMLTTAAGETSALSSQQRNYIEKVVQALNDAIVARG